MSFLPLGLLSGKEERTLGFCWPTVTSKFLTLYLPYKHENIGFCLLGISRQYRLPKAQTERKALTSTLKDVHRIGIWGCAHDCLVLFWQAHFLAMEIPRTESTVQHSTINPEIKCSLFASSSLCILWYSRGNICPAYIREADGRTNKKELSSATAYMQVVISVPGKRKNGFIWTTLENITLYVKYVSWTSHTF